MNTWALHNEHTVVNVVIADSVADLTDLDGLQVIETTGEPWIGWTLEVDGWRPPAPFPSWSWDGTSWQPPIKRPDADVVWDEDTQAWVPGPAPFASWSWDGTTWQPPIERPDNTDPAMRYRWDEDTQAWVLVQRAEA